MNLILKAGTMALYVLAIFLMTSCDPPPYSVGITGSIASTTGQPLSQIQATIQITVYDSFEKTQLVTKEVLTNSYGTYFLEISASELKLIPFAYEAHIAVDQITAPLHVIDEVLPSDHQPEGSVRFAPVYLAEDCDTHCLETVDDAP